ncbi:MAG: alpha-mannosidase [Planctomycetota bacterium]
MGQPPLREITVHMVGNAHIDPVWLWRADEGFAEIARTCRVALERMEETPGFVFCRSSAAAYQWLEEHEPELFARIRERVAEGRWCLVGGWWVQADCNLPCGESFIRQALLGKRYFQDRFGIDVRVGYNVDSFGHHAQLPQILKGCGLDSYVFFRPGPHEKELPAGLFRWQAPDGTEVLACRPPHHYNTGPDEIGDRIVEAAGQAPLGLGHVLCFYGVGDHGGGPTKANIASILAAAEDPEAPNAIFSTPQAFFEEVEGWRRKLPVVAEELQHHARGCYSVLAAIKRANHEAEQLLLAAERFDALATAAFGDEPRREALTEAWQTVLFHQFHDILAGTSIPEAYNDAWPLLDRARETALGVLTHALEGIALHVDTVGEGDPVVFFNSLGWDRDEVVELQPEILGDERAEDVVVLNDRFEPVPTQVEEGFLVFRVHVPSMGFATWRFSRERERGDAETSLAATATSLENEFLRLDVDPATGLPCLLRDKRTGADLITEPGAALVVLRDESDTWAHGVESFRDEVGRFEPAGEPELVEDGPVRAGIRVAYRWGESEAEQTFYLCDGLARVDASLWVDWHEQHKMLKLAVPTALADPRATFSIPFGAVTRPTSGEEEPIQRWLDLTGTADGQAAGLALCNDGLYGADVLGSEMRLSVLRSPIYAFHDPREPEPGETYRYTDQGEHLLRYRLVPHAGSWQDAGVAREARSLNVPVYFRYEMVRDGDITSVASAVTVEPATVLLSALKLAEDGEDVVVRVRESAGRATDATVTLHFAELDWSGRLRPFEIRTLRFDLDGQRVREVDMLERYA